jgi:hypothetical protein
MTDLLYVVSVLLSLLIAVILRSTGVLIAAVAGSERVKPLNTLAGVV